MLRSGSYRSIASSRPSGSLHQVVDRQTEVPVVECDRANDGEVLGDEPLAGTAVAAPRCFEQLRASKLRRHCSSMPT